MKRFRRKGQQAQNDKTERVTGLGRRTREEIAKWNQMTALRFQTGGRHQISPAPLRRSQLKNMMSTSLSVIKVEISVLFFEAPTDLALKRDRSNVSGAREA